MTGVGFVMSSKRFSSARASLSFLAFRILSARRWFSASSRACASFNSTHSFLRGEPHGAAVWVADVAVAHDFEPSRANEASASSSAAGVGLAASSGAAGVGLAASSGAEDVGLAASSVAEGVGLAASSVAEGVGLAASSGAAGVGLAASSVAEGVWLAASSVAGDVRLAASSGAEDVELVALPGAKEPGLAASPALGDSPKRSASETSLAGLADDTPASPAHPKSISPHAVHDADSLRLCKDILG